MSKMNKTQVAHLEQRLKNALNAKANEKFPTIPLIATSQDDINLKAREFSKTLKLDYQTFSYQLRNVATAVLRNKQPEVDTKNRETTVKRNEYRSLQTVKINEILDEAILGDSTEALEALKAFQAADVHWFVGYFIDICKAALEWQAAE